MVKIFKISIAFLCVFASVCLGVDNKSDDWYREKWEIVEKAKNDNGYNYIVELGYLVRGLASRRSSLSEEAIRLYDDAQKTLISIPGCANWFSNEIKKLTEGDLAGTSTAHSEQRAWYYEILAQLPTPETVAALGELVMDERDPWKDRPTTDGGRWHPNSVQAATALNALGISNAPVSHKFYEEGDSETWQLWFEQVRAGNKTFSFEGDPQVYNLRGPVSTAVAPESSRSGERPPLQARSQGESGKGEAGESVPWWPLAVAGGLVVAGVWLVRRSRFLRSGHFK